MHAFLPTAVSDFNWQASTTLIEQCLIKIRELQMMFVNSLPGFKYGALSRNKWLQNNVNFMQCPLCVKKP